MSANMIWTSAKDKILIDFVRNHEPLYNVRSRDYRNAELKQNLWNDIGNILEKSGGDCCKRWGYVRGYYIRRREKPGIGSGGEAAKKRSDLLSFLDNFPATQKNTSTDVVGDDLPNENEITEYTQADIGENIRHIDETESMIRINCNEDIYKDDSNKGDGRKEDMRDKNKLTHSEERLQPMNEMSPRHATPAQKELDETDLFFNSMAKIIKKLPRYEQVQLRMQISSLVGNAELRSISNHSKETSDSSSRSSTTFPERILSPATNEAVNDHGQIYYVSDTSSDVKYPGVYFTH